jgi:serine/threonine protein kinase
MNYPLISEYIEAIKSAEDNFEELSYLRPVLGDDGLPLMTSGNFAVVFKMKDGQNGKFYAVKCFTKEQEGRAEAYREIGKELENVSSPYILSIRYLEKELFVDTDQTAETEFPVLLMEWVEGKTLDKYLRENLDDKYALEMLAYRFSLLAQWLIPQPFAHGDLKPDNILVREDGTLVLVDYDGMYVPSMKGQKARELGSPDFRHPQRTVDDFDEHIDVFPLMSIMLSLKAISINPLLLEEYGAPDRLILSDRDYSDSANSRILKELYPSSDSELNVIIGLFTILIERKEFHIFPSHLLCLSMPITDEELDALAVWEEIMREKVNALPPEDFYFWDPSEIVKTWTFQEFSEMYDSVDLSNVENACIFRRNDIEEAIVYNASQLSFEQINKYKYYLEIELNSFGDYVLISNIPQKWADLNSGVCYYYYDDCWKDEYGVLYRANKKYLLEGPVIENLKGTHIWKKGILNGSYNIQTGTKVIFDKAFFDCRGLTSIKCPSSLRAIGSAAFQNCWSLKEVNLNYGLLEIGDDAFKDCKSLKYIHIPGSISYIASNAFEGSGISIIYTDYGDEKRVKTILPQYVDIIEELPF